MLNTPLTDAIERHFKEKGEWDIQSLLSHSRSLEWNIQSLLSHSRSLEVALDLATTQLAKTKEELSRRPTHEAAERKQKLLEKARNERAAAQDNAFCLQKRINKLYESLNATVEALNCARRERDEMAKIQPGGWAYFESRIEEAERRECTYRLRVEELQELYRKSEAKLDAAMRDVMRMVPQAIIDKTPIGESCVKQLALEYEAKSRECEELREVARNAAAVLDFLL